MFYALEELDTKIQIADSSMISELFEHLAENGHK
jgi:hypothetical protein